MCCAPYFAIIPDRFPGLRYRCKMPSFSDMGFYATDAREAAPPHRAIRTHTCVGVASGRSRTRPFPVCGRKPLRGPIHGVVSGYRYYNSGLGRWLNRDPIGEIGLVMSSERGTALQVSMTQQAVTLLTAGDAGSYSFLRSNPIDLVDSLGLQSFRSGGQFPSPGDRWWDERWDGFPRDPTLGIWWYEEDLQCPPGKCRRPRDPHFVFDRSNRKHFDGCSVPDLVGVPLRRLGLIHKYNEPVEGCSFEDACANHDRCYITCHPAVNVDSEFGWCSLDFYFDLVEACVLCWGSVDPVVDHKAYTKCLVFARLYTFAVDSEFGRLPYDISQRRACGPCECCADDPPVRVPPPPQKPGWPWL